MKAALSVAGALLLSTVFALVVWPTPWRTEAGALGGEARTLRIHRLSGEVQVLTGRGWKTIQGTGPQTATPGTFPPCTAADRERAKTNPYATAFCS